MDRRKRFLLIGVASLVVVGIAAGAVVAAVGDDDRPLTGNALHRATAAALEHVGGGTVIETEVGDDGAAYGVEIRRDDGSVVEVALDRDFRVVAVEGDDDHVGEVEGPGDDD